MADFQNSVGVKVPRILLPNKTVDMQKWAVVACDQYTSEPHYWAQTERIVGNSPSTLRLMLPEMYLDKPGEAERTESINAYMLRYMNEGVLEEKPEGFVLVRRTVDHKTRTGLIVALDLEAYDYKKGASTLIRATEGTIVERIPPRLRIRKDAPLELPHILVLIDDPNRTVIEPLAASTRDAERIYDFDLMQRGGHIEGYLFRDEKHIRGALDALSALCDPAAFAQKYGADKPPMLFAMGDGNHSFATAKANWERCKENLNETERLDHPARFCLVELENVHDSGIVFEPIHRVLFDAEGAAEKLKLLLTEQNGGCSVETFPSRLALAAFAQGCAHDEHILPFVSEKGLFAYVVDAPAAQLAVGTLQNALDAYLKEHKKASVDYIHGSGVVFELGAKPNNLGFLLPPMKKAELFKTVVFDGALPRKTFSMGEAHEKRYYLECRKITK
ncbi:MAG: DUF1015 domain-containing protein [Eubacteriales bacterium]|nr:DUF1015 domain-containing protein [Eubacteriales bacterium]